MTTEPFRIYATEIFKRYTTEDFVLDKRFRKLVTREMESDKFIEEFIEKHPEQREAVFLAIKILKELKVEKYQNSNEQKIEIWERIVKKNKLQVRLNYFRYAAAFLMLIGIGSASLYFLNQKPASEYFVASKESVNNNVSLILSDGKKLVITRKQSEVLYRGDGTISINNDSITLEQPVIGNGINQINVPYGKRSIILLSDGTKVWLNSGSMLVYSPVFKGKIREVFLEGEAYFVVAKDADKPFYVKTYAYNVKVLGTRFNVMAYKKNNHFNTVLLEGKVSLNANRQLFPKEVFLAPNQKASYIDGTKNFQISEVDNIENYIGWIDGYLYFDNEEISSVIEKVSRYYNITIEFMLLRDRTRISGKLDLKDDPERLLKGLAAISKLRCLKQEDKYMFYE